MNERCKDVVFLTRPKDDDLSQVAALVARCQQDAGQLCLHAGETASGLEREMSEFENPFPEGFLVARKGGRLVGAVGANVAEGRGEIHGPFSVESDPLVFSMLLDALLKSKMAQSWTAFPGADATQIHSLLESQGFIRGRLFHVYQARPEDVVTRADESVREHAPEDDEEWMALHRSCFPRTTRESARRILDGLRSGKDDRLFILKREGRLVAYAFCWPQSEPEEGYLDFLGTHPDFRGQGLAGRLLRFVAHHFLLDRGAALVQLCVADEARNARQLYLRSGYRAWRQGWAFTKES